jgi:hypothetical protein
MHCFRARCHTLESRASSLKCCLRVPSLLDKQAEAVPLDTGFVGRNLAYEENVLERRLRVQNKSRNFIS